MARQISARQHSCGFQYRHFTILKDHTLGHGSYGAVYKARCDQLTCAAKVLHPTIVDSFDPGSERILQRFRQECDFLNQTRHPHIVQYLGVCRDPESNLPVLLMELLDESLTKMLERSQLPLPYSIQVDLFHDVAVAIAYLHSNGIIHRDLSGNNVLVVAGRRAKVTDFGMSKLDSSGCLNLTPLTTCPGTVAYMSPESLREPPMYTEKLDIFSEGVIMIQICTRKFPDPGPPMNIKEDPQSPTGTIQIPVLEMDRRKNHIDLIKPTHPLLPIAADCLEYRERDRPSADELCERLTELKVSQEYIESVQQMNQASSTTAEVTGTLQHEHNVLTRQLEEKTQIIQTKDQQILQSENQIRDKEQQIESKQYQILAKDQQIQQLNELLRDNEQVTAQIQETNEQLCRQNDHFRKQIEDLQHQAKFAPEPAKPLSERAEYDLRWKDGEKAQFGLARGSSVVDGDVAYFPSGTEIYSYNSSTNTWRILPNCPQIRGSLAMVKGLLTKIGGKQATIQGKVTNKLVSFTKAESADSEWIEKYPPMPTSRSFTSAATYQNHLVVAGGSSSGRFKDNVATVEVLNTDTLVWSIAASLPHPFSNASITVCGDHLYMLGGSDTMSKKLSVLTCSLPEVLQSCQPRSLIDKLFKWGRNAHSQKWQFATDIPVYDSTCTTVNGQLIAIGGCDENDKRTTAVYKYNTARKSWGVISHIATARSLCFVATVMNVNSSQLLVVGGRINVLESAVLTNTNSVEIAEF